VFDFYKSHLCGKFHAVKQSKL